MVSAPPAFIVVLVVIAAIVGLMFFIIKLSKWSHEGGEGGEGYTEGAEHRSFLDSVGERLGEAQDIVSKTKELDAGIKELRGEQAEEQVENFAVNEEIRRAAALLQMNAVMKIIHNKGLYEPVPQFGNQHANAVLFGYAQRYLAIVRDEINRIKQVANLEKYKERMTQFQTQMLKVEKNKEAMQKKIGDRKKADDIKLDGALKKRFGGSKKAVVAGYVNRIRQLDLAITNRITEKQNFEKNELNQVIKERSAEVSVDKLIVLLEKRMTTELSNTVSLINSLGSAASKPMNIIGDYSRLSVSAINAAKVFHKLLDAQKRELLFHKNKLDLFTKHEKMSYIIISTMKQNDIVEAKLDKITGDGKDAKQETSEATNAQTLVPQESKNFALTQQEKIIIDADIKRIDGIKKRLDYVITLLQKSNKY